MRARRACPPYASDAGGVRRRKAAPCSRRDAASPSCRARRRAAGRAAWGCRGCASWRSCLLPQSFVQPGIDPAGVAFEYLRLVRRAEVELVDVALGVVEVVPGLRIDALHRAEHLRGE